MSQTLLKEGIFHMDNFANTTILMYGYLPVGTFGLTIDRQRPELINLVQFL